MKVQLGHGGDSMESQSKINTQFCAYFTKRIWLFNFKQIQIQILERDETQRKNTGCRRKVK